MTAPPPSKDGLRRYNVRGANPDGTPEDRGCCIEVVYTSDRFPRPHQCSRKRGHGPDGLYCRQHDPVAVAAAEAARKVKWEATAREVSRRFKIQRAALPALRALQEIAKGHPDPRDLALAALTTAGFYPDEDLS